MRRVTFAVVVLLAIVADASAQQQPAAQPAQAQPQQAPPLQPGQILHDPPAQIPQLGRQTNFYAPGQHKSSNIKLVSHLPLAGYLHQADIEIEQELSRPYVYVSKRYHPYGFNIISIADQAKPKVIYSWTIENSELHLGAGSLQARYFKTKGRYYYVQTFQFRQGGPDVDLGAAVFDVTGLPDPAKIKEIGRIRDAESPGGFHEHFLYKHSDGRPLLIVTTTSPHANVYDMDKFVAGDPKQGYIGQIPVPEGANSTLPQQQRGYHDFYVAYDPNTHQDKFYGAGAGGYYVYDISKPEAPALLTALTGISGVTYGHTINADPNGRYALVETEYTYAPLRMFDLKPDGKQQAVQLSRPIGAWNANWKDLSHNFEIRWPYVFVSAYEDGMHVLNIMDPTNPVTVGFFDSYDGPHEPGGSTVMGTWGVDVRNADGLIVVSDMMTGLWAFKMEGFDGWNGHDWGMPNISSAQDWDNGPDGAPKGAKPVT